MNASLLPNGNILPSTVVKQDPANTGYCLQSGSGDVPYGIAGPYTRRIELDGYATNYIGIAGDPAILIYTHGAINVPVRLGGTVSNGDPLKSDGSGYLVSATTDKDQVVARARASGISGQVIPADVLIYNRSV